MDSLLANDVGRNKGGTSLCGSRVWVRAGCETKLDGVKRSPPIRFELYILRSVIRTPLAFDYPYLLLLLISSGCAFVLLLIDFLDGEEAASECSHAAETFGGRDHLVKSSIKGTGCWSILP